MKKVIVTITLGIIGLVAFAQNNKPQQLIKYVTYAPDGSVAVTITDDTTKVRMKVESADIFYKYQVLDQKTSESVYTSKNGGKGCIIDKSKFADGTYDLRLYTSNFVITTDLEILKMGESYAALKHDMAMAKNDMALAVNNKNK